MMRGHRKARLATLLVGALAAGAVPVWSAPLARQALASQELYVPTAQTSVAPASNMNDADLFNEYVKHRFSGDGTTNARGSRLSGANRNVYDVLAQAVTEIAEGRRASTAVEVPIQCLSSKTYWTASELGMSSVIAADGSVSEAAVDAVRRALTPDMAAIRSALSQDLRRELYWYDNGSALKFTLVGLTVTWDQIRVADAGIVVYLPVAPEFSQGTCAIDTAPGALVDGAVRNAEAIIAESKSMDTLERLAWFRRRICDYASYDTPVPGEAVPFGDYWQLVYVFDGNAGTEALCEGYAKAFKYLCDQADVPGITCTTVSGTMGGSSHSWNIVERGGLNYLVDVTNCDAGTLGAPDRLFMTREAAGSVKGGFTVSPAGCPWSLTYVYDAATLAAHPASTLDILNRRGGGSYLAAGTWGTCAWDIDADGTLTVREGTLAVAGAVGARGEKTSPWAAYRADVRHVVLEDDVVLPASSDCLFAGLSCMVSAEVRDADASKATSMRSMFAGCAKLASLDLSGWDTAAVKDAKDMFSGCSAIEEFTVGDAYKVSSKDMVPRARAARGWWSRQDRSWYTADQIASTRDAVADTYVAHEVAPLIDLQGKATVTLSETDFTFDGSAHVPEATVTLDGKALKAGRDFDVRYADNTDAGTATLTVTGKGAYEGSLQETFEIEPASIEDFDVEVAEGEHVFAARAILPAVYVTRGDESLERGRDFTVDFDDNTDAGTATVTVTGKGNYQGTTTATFEILPESLEGASVSTAEDSYEYTGEPVRPTVTVKFGARTLRRGVDYAVDYADNTEEGTATVTVTGEGNYEGVATTTFDIA